MSLFDKNQKTTKPSQPLEYQMPSEADQEMNEALSFVIHSGFLPPDQISPVTRQIIADVCEDNNIPLPPAGWINDVIQRQLSNANAKEAGANNYLRLRSVFDALNRERIIAVHFAGYTMQEGFEEVGKVFQFMKANDIPRRGYCFYHKQDIERAMYESEPRLFLAFHSMNDDKEMALEVGERIVELLTEEGFAVEWNHTPKSRIAINPFLWDKVYDGEDYGADRAIRVMGEAQK